MVGIVRCYIVEKEMLLLATTNFVFPYFYWVVARRRKEEEGGGRRKEGKPLKFVVNLEIVMKKKYWIHGDGDSFIVILNFPKGG